MERSRRVWCSCVVIDYLVGNERIAPDGQLIIDAAERGEIEIVVSALAECEVAKLDDSLSDRAEGMIREFFSRSYIVRANLDPPVAEIARDLVRKFGIGGPDAAHVATAVHWRIPIFETVDTGVIKKMVGGLQVDPRLLPYGLIVQWPAWEGQRRLIDLLDDSAQTPDRTAD